MTQESVDTQVVSFMAEIRQALKDIIRRLEDGQSRMKAHEEAIQEQRVRCAKCEAEYRSSADTVRTLHARVVLAEETIQQARGEARGTARMWAAIAVVLSLVIAAANWLAPHAH